MDEVFALLSIYSKWRVYEEPDRNGKTSLFYRAGTRSTALIFGGDRLETGRIIILQEN
ncbi:hypothetical protein [Bacillus sp. B-jedd]|uniref:hypothetical protein n=1 Tax=Bacillus sp. B-jedd TaxID=1476857 RepID=UPI000515655E|nr:hypothetical protein [Bacillus sp. B-jedd]CEG29071.1 hypothetical protein BN1002_04001 [Bacillus sp. B-jedd]